MDATTKLIMEVGVQNFIGIRDYAALLKRCGVRAPQVAKLILTAEDIK